MVKKKKKISVHAYKFDGLLYRSWEFPKIIKEDSAGILVSAKNALVLTNNKKKHSIVHSKLNMPIYWYFPKNKWYNIMFLKKTKWYSYINVASPYVFSDETLMYIDFDLDFKIPDIDGKIINELDIREYSENAVKYNYPIELKELISKVEQEIITLHSNEEIKSFFYNNIKKK